MNLTSQNEVIEVMLGRHAVKMYDPAHKATREDVLQLLEISQQAPSAWNLQPWKYLVIHEQPAKEKLLPIAFGQQQIVQSAFTVVVLGDKEAQENAELIYGEAVKQGVLPADIKDRLVSQIYAAYADEQVAREQAILNASLSAMQLMLAAKALGYGTCPLGGFDGVKLIEAFKVPERYVPLMLITVGKAAEPARPSSRFPMDQVAVWNTF